jgi:hypothetical protein
MTSVADGAAATSLLTDARRLRHVSAAIPRDGLLQVEAAYHDDRPDVVVYDIGAWPRRRVDGLAHDRGVSERLAAMQREIQASGGACAGADIVERASCRR